MIPSLSASCALALRKRRRTSSSYDIFGEVKALICRVFDNASPIFAERFSALTLRQSAHASLDDWVAVVFKQTGKFDFEHFSFDDFQVLLYTLGLQSDVLSKELFKRMNISASRMNPMTLTDAHKLCKDQVKLEEACSAICQTIKVQGNTTSQVLSDAAPNAVNLEEKEEDLSSTHQVNARNRMNDAMKKGHGSSTNSFLKPCWYCGQEHLNLNRDCPHSDKICNKCHKVGHLAAVCRGELKTRTQAVFAVATPTPTSRKFIRVQLNDRPTKLQLDTPSDVTLISKELWREIGSPRMAPSTFAAKHAGGGALSILGETTIGIRLENRPEVKWT